MSIGSCDEKSLFIPLYPFILIITEDLWHTHFLPSVQQWNCHYLFNNLDLSWLGFGHPICRMQGECFNRLCHRFGDIIKDNAFLPILCIFTICIMKPHPSTRNFTPGDIKIRILLGPSLVIITIYLVWLIHANGQSRR